MSPDKRTNAIPGSITRRRRPCGKKTARTSTSRSAKSDGRWIQMALQVVPGQAEMLQWASLIWAVTVGSLYRILLQDSLQENKVTIPDVCSLRGAVFTPGSSFLQTLPPNVATLIFEVISKNSQAGLMVTSGFGAVVFNLRPADEQLVISLTF